jgi:hypothetical protein
MSNAPQVRRTDKLMSDERALAIADGGVLGDVHGERGFAHRGAGRDDDEIGRLKAAGELVELRVMSAKAGDLLAVDDHPAFPGIQDRCVQDVR